MIWGRIIDLFRRRRLDADLDAQLPTISTRSRPNSARKGWR